MVYKGRVHKGFLHGYGAHFPGTGDAHNESSSESGFQQTRFANGVCFVSKQAGSDQNAQRYWQCHNEKIIKPLTHDVVTEFTYQDISEARICERTWENWVYSVGF